MCAAHTFKSTHTPAFWTNGMINRPQRCFVDDDDDDNNRSGYELAGDEPELQLQVKNYAAI